MATITALTAQKKNANRVNLFLDDQFAFGLETAVAIHLRVGQILSETDIAALQDREKTEQARANALNLLTYRPRSVAEIRQHLHKKEFDDAAIDQVIARLQAVELLDDKAFARYWVEQRETFKPRSHMALRQELRNKGVDRSVIDTVLEDVDETAAARRVAAKQSYRWATLPKKEFQVKLGQFLQRRGFPYMIITEITNETWQSLAAGSEDNYTELH